MPHRNLRSALGHDESNRIILGDIDNEEDKNTQGQMRLSTPKQKGRRRDCAKKSEGKQLVYGLAHQLNFALEAGIYE
jgi:hypothetical protein